MWVVLVIALIVFLVTQREEISPPALKGAQADVSSAIITRSLPSTVKVNTAFTADYTASAYGAGSWGVLIEDAVSGGCSPASINTGFLSPSTNTPETITAPAIIGICTFSGTYIFAGDVDEPIVGDTTVTVCQDACSAGQIGCYDSDTRWTCDTSGVCGIQTNHACTAYEFCDAGICVADCAGNLKPDALSAIVAWSIDPSSGNRQTALNAILLWAINC